MNPEVFVACPMTASFTAELGKHFVVHLSDGKPPALQNPDCQRIRGLVTNGIRGAERALIELFPKLEIISSLGIGVDAVDLDFARSRGVAVTNTPGVVTADVADLAMAMLIDRLRNIVAGDRFIRAGKWRSGPAAFGRSVTGKRLGIVGLGGIGKAIARRAEAFDLRVKWYGPRAKPDVPYEYVPNLKQLARESDALVVACSGGKETRHLINAPVIAALGPKGNTHQRCAGLHRGYGCTRSRAARGPARERCAGCGRASARSAAGASGARQRAAHSASGHCHARDPWQDGRAGHRESPRSFCRPAAATSRGLEDTECLPHRSR